MDEKARRRTHRRIEEGRACPECGAFLGAEDIGGGRCTSCGSSICAATKDEAKKQADTWLSAQRKEAYEVPRGTRIALTEMRDDPDPLPIGLRGTVRSSVRASAGGKEDWTVEVKWDNGRTLNLICPPDEFVVADEGDHEQFKTCCPRCGAGPYDAKLTVTYAEVSMDDVELEPDGFDLSAATRSDTTNEQVTCAACGQTFPLGECLLTEGDE